MNTLPPSYEESLTGSWKPPTASPIETPTFEKAPLEIKFDILTDKELRDACYEYIADECCYGSKFIKDMTLTDIDNNYSFHYKLESFGEKRETKWTCTAYHGQGIDGPENGPPPAPWDMRVKAPVYFKKDRTCEEIPHTATVERCATCFAEGRVRCSYCYGDGFNKCTTCDGRRRTQEGWCIPCNGTGRRGCLACSGRGRVNCSTCNGQCRVKRYKELIVTWTNHVDEHRSGSMKLSKQLLKECNAKQIFIEEDVQVLPISHTQDPNVQEASTKLIQKHKTSFPQEQILMQRHTLWAVPLTRAKYLWKSWQDEFYVYGFEKKVYFEHYPQQCCCCTCF